MTDILNVVIKEVESHFREMGMDGQVITYNPDMGKQKTFLFQYRRGHNCYNLVLAESFGDFMKLYKNMKEFADDFVVLKMKHYGK